MKPLMVHLFQEDVAIAAVLGSKLEKGDDKYALCHCLFVYIIYIYTMNMYIHTLIYIH